MIKHTLKQTKFEDKTVKSTLTLVNGLHDFPDFPDRARMREAWKREHMFGLSLFRPSRQSNIPSLGRTRSVKCPTPGTTKTIKSPPHALPPPPRLNIDRCIIPSTDVIQLTLTLDDYRTGCRNVSHCQQQQSYSGLRSPGRSNSTYFRKNTLINGMRLFSFSREFDRLCFSKVSERESKQICIFLRHLDTNDQILNTAPDAQRSNCAYHLSYS